MHCGLSPEAQDTLHRFYLVTWLLPSLSPAAETFPHLRHPYVCSWEVSGHLWWRSEKKGRAKQLVAPFGEMSKEDQPVLYKVARLVFLSLWLKKLCMSITNQCEALSRVIFAMDSSIETNTRLWLTQWKKLYWRKENLYVRRKAQQDLSICPHSEDREKHHMHRVSLLGAQAEMSQSMWMWLFCVFMAPGMSFPRKVFLCPQKEVLAKEFSGSSCCDSPLSTHLPPPSKVFAQVIFSARPPIAKLVLAYSCSLFLLCFPLECQSLFFTLSLPIVLMFAFSTSLQAPWRQVAIPTVYWMPMT